MKRFLFAIALMFSCFQAIAQNFVNGTLKDAASLDPVGFATVSLTAKGSTKAAKYSMTDEKGNFRFESVKKGTYIVKAELLGYKAVEKEITVDKPLSLGDILMNTEMEQLEGATVSAVGNAILIKKDTIEYNASSFKTTENDVLEDLLKKLPGVEVSEDGSITVNGNTIQKITIDGKTFFLDDPQLASKNIPAKLINKLKVIEKKSEQAEFTGIDDGEEEHVIDLSIKKGMMKGVFGNLTAGGGADVPTNSTAYNSARWQGAGFIGKFTEKSNISVLLGANNTNNRGFNDLSGGMMGDMRGGGMGQGQGGWGGGNGITTSYMGGVNGAWNLFDDRMKLGANYLYNNSNRVVEEASDKTTYTDDNYNLFYHNQGSNTTYSGGHRFGVRLEHKFSQNTSIIFQPQFNFGNGSFSENSEFYTRKNLLSGGTEDVNDGNSLNTGSNRNWTASGYFLYRQKLGLPGRTLTANIRYNLSNNDLVGVNKSVTNYANGDNSSVVDQNYTQNRRNASLSGGLTYTEPMGNHFYVEANYNYSWNRSTSAKDTYDNVEKKHSDTYSSNIVNEYVNQTIGANLLYQSDKLRAQIGLSAKPTKTRNNTEKGSGYKIDTTYNVLNWSPQAMLRFDFNENSNLRINYRGNTSQPSTSRLIPIPDNTNPLNVTFGNPTLRPYFSHSLSGTYRFNDKRSFTSFTVSFNGGMVSNPIVSAIWTGAGTGVQYSMPFNGPNSMNGGFNFFFNIPVAKSNFTVSNTLNANWSNSASYVGKNIDMSKYIHSGELDYDLFLKDYGDIGSSSDFTENITNTLSVMERLRFTYRLDNLELQLSGRTRFNQSWYTVSSKNRLATWSNQLRGSVNWTWDLIGTTLKADYNYNWYNNYTTPKEPESILNIEIQKMLFKNKVTLALRGYDILGQSKNLSVRDSDNYHMESVNNTLGRYVILSLTYRFGTFERPGPGGRGGSGHGGPGAPPAGRGPAPR